MNCQLCKWIDVRESSDRYNKLVGLLLGWKNFGYFASVKRAEL